MMPGTVAERSESPTSTTSNDSLSENLLASPDELGQKEKKLNRENELCESLRTSDNDDDDQKLGIEYEGPPRKKLRNDRDDNSESDLSMKGCDFATVPDACVIRKKTVDWDAQVGGKWVEEPLDRRLNASELSALISIATNLTCTEPNVQLSARGEADTNEVDATIQEASIQNPLIGLDSIPLPPSYLDFLARRASHFSSSNLNLEEAFDDSALVAIGICLEEMITASMLPMARLHVQRCRAIEEAAPRLPDGSPIRARNRSKEALFHPITGEPNEGTIEADTTDVFDEWTLPPEESLLRLLGAGRLGPSGIMPTSRPPTRTILSNTNAEKITKNMHKLSGKTWCSTHGLDTAFVRDNKHIFQAFLTGDQLEFLSREDKKPKSSSRKRKT